LGHDPLLLLGTSHPERPVPRLNRCPMREGECAMMRGDHDETRVVAQLPHLDLVLVHRRPRGDDGEQMVIALRAVPSFDGFGRLLAAANPLLFWMRLTQAVWSPWLDGLGAAATPPPRVARNK
jgi:hypothetical protein